MALTKFVTSADKVNTQFIVKILGKNINNNLFSFRSHPIFAMEYLPISFKHVIDLKFLSLEQKRLTAYYMLRGLAAAHNINVVHRDLKLDNIRFD